MLFLMSRHLQTGACVLRWFWSPGCFTKCSSPWMSFPPSVLAKSISRELPVITTMYQEMIFNIINGHLDSCTNRKQWGESMWEHYLAVLNLNTLTFLIIFFILILLLSTSWFNYSTMGQPAGGSILLLSQYYLYPAVIQGSASVSSTHGTKARNRPWRDQHTVTMHTLTYIMHSNTAVYSVHLT